MVNVYFIVDGIDSYGVDNYINLLYYVYYIGGPITLVGKKFKYPT